MRYSTLIILFHIQSAAAAAVNKILVGVEGDFKFFNQAIIAKTVEGGISAVLPLFDICFFYNQTSIHCTNAKRRDVDAYAWISGQSFKIADDKVIMSRLGLAFDSELFGIVNNRRRWKIHMSAIGLGDYVANSFTVESAQFPCLVKTDLHWGRGTNVVSNRKELHKIIDPLRSDSYVIEEALMGWENREVHFFGSVYKGKLISARCAARAFRNSTFKDGVFVQGVNLSQYTMAHIHCTQELVTVMDRFFGRRELYTGPFCADIKSNSTGHPKILEINARLCASVGTYPDLFLSTFVPLAFSIVSGLKNSNESLHHPPSWYSNNRSLYAKINRAEAANIGSERSSALKLSPKGFKRFGHRINANGTVNFRDKGPILIY